MEFKNFWILLLIPIVIIFIVWYRSRQRQPAIRFPSLELAVKLPKTWRVHFHAVPFYINIIVVVLFLIALAGPRKIFSETIRHTEALDIVLTIDTSGSMAAEDFFLNNIRVNRLDVVKNVVKDFIDGRPSDRISLVAFSALAYVVSPLTLDHQWLQVQLERIRLGLIKDGTAIGSAIATSVTRLQKSKAKSKVVILLTDGMNNSGKVDPLSAAKAAKAFGIKIYTIGAGTKGLAPFPVMDIWGRKVHQRVRIDMDEETLKEIAGITGAKYFRATDTETLRRVYKEIDTLEKTKIEEIRYKEYAEFFGHFLIAGLVLLAVQLFLTQTVFLQIP